MDNERSGRSQSPIDFNCSSVFQSSSFASQIKELGERQAGFHCVHIATTQAIVGDILNLVCGEPGLLPARTGHIGDWQAILNGCSGALDFNNVILKNQFGYPLLYSFTQTEDAAFSTGDCAYLPGSRLVNGKRIAAPIYTWEDGSFKKRDRSKSFFVPFSMTEDEGEIRPLTSMHWNKLKRSGILFENEASSLVRNEEKLRKMLITLIEIAAASHAPSVAFRDLSRRQVTLGGEVVPADFLKQEKQFVFGSCTYKDAESLAIAMTMPLRAAHDPDDFFGNIRSRSSAFPLISNLVARLLSGFENSSPTRISGERISLHFHWAARSMGGFPPFSTGYAAQKSFLRSIRRLGLSIVTQYDKLNPVMMVLLPASIFMLYAVRGKDADVVAELIQSTLSKVNNPENNEIAKSEARTVVRDWLARNSMSLSPYFLSKFRPTTGYSLDSALSVQELCEPEGFRKLTFRQACLIVGALHEMVDAA